MIIALCDQLALVERITLRSTMLAKLILTCLFSSVAAIGEGGTARGRWGAPATRTSRACFATHVRGDTLAIGPTSRSFSRHRSIRRTVVWNSPENDGGDAPEDAPSPYLDDQDGVPLFDANERGTLFGLEPKADLDPLDNGLQFTGPVILFLSIYVTLSLFFADDVPPLDL